MSPTPIFPEPVHVGRPNMGSREAFHALVDGIFDRAWLSNAGPLVEEFERQLARFLGVRHVVAMASGTVALEIAVRSAGLAGEVIVPAFSFVATAHALSWMGIRPVFADIDPRTHQVDPVSVKGLITDRTTGIIGVHLWGHPAPVDELAALADDEGLHLLFDAAHAFGTSIDGRLIGSFGAAEVFSFHATKFFNTFEGGAVATDDDALAERARLMRNFGFRGYDNVVSVGTNGKMTEVCAAMGLVNLGEIDTFIARNRVNYECYAEALAGVPGVTLFAHDRSLRRNYQYVVIETERPSMRDRVVADLHQQNVLARKYFWPGIHRMEPYRSAPEGIADLPVTDDVAGRVVVLPTGSAVDAAAIDVIADVIRRSIREGRARA